MEDRRRRPLEQGLSGPFGTLAIDDLGTAIHQLHHVGEEFGRVLEIGIDQQDTVAARRLQAGHHGHLLPEVAPQPDADDMGVPSCQVRDHLPRPVGRAVIDQDDLEVPGRRRHGGRARAAMELADRLVFVETGRDDRHPRTVPGRKPRVAVDHGGRSPGRSAGNHRGCGVRWKMHDRHPYAKCRGRDKHPRNRAVTAERGPLRCRRENACLRVHPTALRMRDPSRGRLTRSRYWE